MSTAPSPERRGFVISLPTDIFAWADAYNNFYGIAATISIWLASSRSRRREAAALLSSTVGCVSSKPVLSTLILCGLMIPVAVAVVYTDQFHNQAFLACVGLLLGVWLWRGINQNLDRAEGYMAAGLFIPIVALMFGGVAYLPNF